MASISLDQNGDCIDDIPVEQLLPSDYDDCGEANVFPQIPSDCYDAGDAFGEPDILPRIGDEYQAELPPLIGEANHMSYSEVGHHSLQNFIGLPITLTWISCLKHECPEIVSDSRHSDTKNVIETGTFCNGDIGPSHDSVKPKEESQNLPADEKIRKCSGEGYLLVPGLLNESWSDAEKASFLLALYIFEKNFVEVRRFIEAKDMGSILSFFYGDFYGSDEYRRWSEGRKTKSKKCAYGQRIFSGLRQQELLSRLLPRVSEECKSALLEVSNKFGGEKISLVDYVSSLKAMVGMNILVEAVGVGTGKQDLTGMALEPLRSNQVIPVRPEIPAGKACSSLTTTEIVKFLSGDYRLSKARSNDLFWEAVWPRLLARGWHSEQPQNQGYIAGSKHFLVFLMPGVKKFSRRKLVKGDHYFDSVTDVLSKVAKEPGLIELDNEEADGKKNKEEHEWNSERKLEEEENHLPTRQRHSYLQPRTPNRSMHAIKFTVVDTSLSDGKVRELKTLPSEISNTLISHHHPEDSDEDTLEENTGESDAINTITLDVSVTDTLTAKSDGKMLPGRKNHDGDSSCQDIHTVNPDISKSSVPLKNKKDLNDNKKPRKLSKSLLSRKQKQGNVDDIIPISKRYTITLDVSVTDTLTAKSDGKMLPGRKNHDGNSSCQDIHTVNPDISKSSVLLKNKKDLNDNKKPRKLSKSLLSRKQKQGNVDDIIPISKRCRRLTANSNKETRDGVTHSSMVPRLENGMSSCCSGTHEFNENFCSQVSSCQDKLSSTSSSKGSPCESIECAPTNNIHATEPFLDNPQTQLLIDPQTQLLIDLNLPQVFAEFENDVLATNLTKEPDNQPIKLDNQSLPKSSLIEARSEQQSTVNPRRHSTRNRPPTTRALEAVANGYLTVTRRRKGRDISSHDALPSRPSQRPRFVVGPNESPNSSVASQIEEAEKGVSNSGTSNILNKFHDPPEANEESVSRQ